MHWAAAPTGEPGKAPASYISFASAATIFPSLVTPILTCWYVPDVGPVASITSVRVIVSFTGRPDLCDRTQAIGSRYVRVLPPNPPPISSGITLMLDAGIPSTAAVPSPIWKWPWELCHSVIRPFGSHHAVAEWGSM